MFSQALAQRHAENNPIRVGIVGVGKFGAGLAAQISQMKGMEASVIADLNIERARNAYTISQVPEDRVQEATSAQAIDDAIRGGKRAITQDGFLLTQADLVDVVVEVTGVPNVGAKIAYEAIQHQKHVVMVTVEADVTVGAMLRRMADQAGVVYTAVDGDQPGCTMNMVDWATTLGFEIVAAGRGTIFYDDDREGLPDTVPARFGFSEAVIARRTINLKMFNSFRDGSKAQIEMTALANMAGLVPDIRGMHEPSVNLADIPQQFSLKEEGGLLSQHGVVELANSIALDGKTLLPDPLRMGVFVVVRTEHPFTQEDLVGYHVHPGGDGHNFLLYRPYHLVAVTAPISIVKAAIYQQPTGSPLPIPTAEVITVAKRDLKAGETLDGSGGYTVNGLCEKATAAHAENLLPLGLADDAVLKQDVPKGAAISYDMVEPISDSFIYQLRQQQDQAVWGD